MQSAKLLEKDVHIVNRKKSGLVITHTGYILDYLDADKGHVMCDGEIKCHGNPREILKEVKARGYKSVLNAGRFHGASRRLALGHRGQQGGEEGNRHDQGDGPTMACQVIDWAMQVHGGAGVSDDFGLANMYAHQRTLRFADGPDEVHRNAIAKQEIAEQTTLGEALATKKP